MTNFINMVEQMLGHRRYQISGEETIFETKAEVDAVLFNRELYMENFSQPATPDAPEWATEEFFVRSSRDDRRIELKVFA